MNLLDLVILGLVALAGYGGHRLGFATRVISWLGMAVGLVVTARFLTTLVKPLSGASPTTQFLAAAGILVGGALVGLTIGLAAGSRVHLALPPEDRPLDHVLGAATGILAVLAAVWLLTPVMAEVPGRLSRLARGSGISRALAVVTPGPPDTLQALKRLVGPAGFPQVLTGLEPSPSAGPPPQETGLSDATVASVATSTVRIEARACGQTQEGSGFVVEQGVVVTNAHVVAGAEGDRVAVVGHDGTRVPGEVVAFDPDRDLALVRAALPGEPIPLADGGPGDRGAVFGSPTGGSLRLAPYAVSEEILARGRDIYGKRQTERVVLVLASELAAGDSGAGLVDAQGRVVGVAFAIAPDDDQTAYALDVEELEAVLSGPRSPVGTGRCLG